MNLFLKYHSCDDCGREMRILGPYTLEGTGNACPVYRGDTSIWHERWDVVCNGEQMRLSYCYDMEAINEVQADTTLFMPQREMFFQMHKVIPYRLVDITVPPDFYDKTLERLLQNELDDVKNRRHRSDRD